MYVKISHLIKTNHIVFSHPILLAIAFIWVCVSMKIADSFVVGTTLVAQFVLNLIGFVHSGLLLYIIPYLCGRNHCKNDSTNVTITNVDRNPSNNSIFSSTTQPTLYTSVPKTSPVQGIRVNEQSSYYISREQQQQQRQQQLKITIIPTSTSSVISNTSTTTDKKEKIELPSYKEKLLITPTLIENNNNDNDSGSSGEEEEIILPNYPPVKSDYILPNNNNVASLADISKLQYDDDDNTLNESSQRSLSTIIEVNEESTPHPHPVSIQFINETQKLFAKAANNNDTRSELHLPQPSTTPVPPPRQIYNISYNNGEQFKSQSETFSLQDQSSNKHNQFMESSSYSYAHSTHYTKRSTGTNIGLFVMPSESTLLVYILYYYY